MEDTEKDAFYVVRKGDIIGVYKSFADCKAQAAFSDIVGSNSKSGLGSFSASPQLKRINLKDNAEHPLHHSLLSCTIEFDGASKGNPGLSGAGAVLRATDGSEVWGLREGVGIATNNVAEYRSVIFGLRTALQKGFMHVRVRGDSLLVCNQEFNSDADALANRAINLRDGQVEMEVTR